MLLRETQLRRWWTPHKFWTDLNAYGDDDNVEASLGFLLKDFSVVHIDKTDMLKGDMITNLGWLGFGAT